MEREKITKNGFVEIVNKRLENKTIDSLVDELLVIYEKNISMYEEQANYLDLLFLLYLDAISKRLYVKESESEVYPLVSKEEYSNLKTPGYFDKVFKAASLYINRIINHANWNIIIKIDAHNNPSGPSRYSLVSEGDYYPGKSKASKAYYLFFLYKEFCDERIKNHELTEDQVYTVHRDLSSKKTIRSITYQNEENAFLRYFDGDLNSKEEATTIDDGESSYLDFLACVLDDRFTERTSSAFANYYNSHKKDEQTKWRTPKSFSFFNLGVSGFESWGTLMIEAFNESNQDGSVQAVNECFFKSGSNNGDDAIEKEDDLRLLKIKSVVSALKKVDDEYNDALNKARIKKEAEKSAKAAIMSRNMSHNLGSHVMAYLKQKLGSVSAILNEENKHEQNKVLYNLYSYKENALTRNAKEDVEMPFLVGLGRFIGYLQERQDYIATIATDYIPYGAPVNMKDAIYDELNPDLRHLRHNTLEDEKDQNRPFNILLSYIAKSEGLSRENMDATGGITKISTSHDILFGYIKYGKTSSENPHIFGLTAETSISSDPALKEMRTINFSLPGGLVGRQAVFSVVENLIRNASKHGDTSQVKNLEFVFDIIDGSQIKNGEAVCINERISDTRYQELYKNAIDIDNLYLLSITDNLTYGEGLTKTLHEGLVEPYIRDGQMTTGNKGIKEIRISAAWLRDDVDERNYAQYEDDTSKNYLRKRFLKAPLVAIELTKERHLRYIIALAKNRKIAFITDGMNEDNTIGFDVLHRVMPNEWYFMDGQSFLKDLKASYGYVIVANKAVYNKIRPKYSNRLVIWSLDNNQTKQLKDIWDTVIPSENRLDYEGKISSMLKVPSSLELLEEKLSSFIYQMYSGIKPEAAVPIYIWDKKTKDAQSPKDIFPLIKVYDTEEEQQIAQYAYRTHHSNGKDFRSFYVDKEANGKYANIESIDAITGDNSSDRLVRRETLNEEWYYSHLRALKKRIAVFDERIFKIVHNVDERNFIVGASNIASLIDNLQKGIVSVDNAIKSLNNREVIVSLKLRKHLNTLYDQGQLSVGTLCEELFNSSRHFAPQESTGNHMSAYYEGKRVIIFTIIKEREKEYAIVACSKNDWVNDNYHCVFDKIGRIYLNESSELSIDVSDAFRNQFDYITIHQGILDKIYEGFGFKQQNDENNAQKCLTTRMLYEAFMCNAKEDIICIEKQEYLPRFIIHSGRAKPTADDMPQKLPFVQFAAIENAIKDCKFSLVQLLDYARYDD